MSGQIYRKLHAELAEAQSRRHKFDVLKISFVTALLGIGGVKPGGATSLQQLLYLVPLVAVLFDLLVMGQHFSIRRIGAFLRHFPESPAEEKYEKFVSGYRDSFFKWGSRGFTAVAYFASVALLWATTGGVTGFELAWFVVLLLIYVAIVWKGHAILKRLDQVTKDEIEKMIEH